MGGSEDNTMVAVVQMYDMLQDRGRIFPATKAKTQNCSASAKP
jgi:hypothetical protein